MKRIEKISFVLKYLVLGVKGVEQEEKTYSVWNFLLPCLEIYSSFYLQWKMFDFATL